MGLSERDRTRYARHLLLAQLGEAGQARLLATRVRVVPSASTPDAGTLEVARTYLDRAGVQVLDGADAEDVAVAALTLPSAAEVMRVAGSAALRDAAGALLGALAAVDVIKRATGLPDSPSQSSLFVISSEEA